MEVFPEPAFFYAALIAHAQRAAARRQIALHLNPLQLDLTRSWARTWPQAPGSVVVGAGITGLPPDSPEALEIIERHFDATEQVNTGFFAPITDVFDDAVSGLKEGVRNTLTFMNDLNWNAVQRPFRAMAIAAESGDPQNGGAGKTPIDLLFEDWPIAQAWEQVGPAPGQLETIEREAGRPVNIDEDAWLPRSIDPVTHPAYTELVGRGMDPKVAYELVVARVGRPVDWELGHRAQREAIVVEGVRDPSPGRLIASTVFEEGEVPYQLMSGLLDATVAVTLDPSSLVLGPIGKASKLGKSIALSDNRLHTVLRSNVPSYLASRQWDNLSAKLATNQSPTYLLDLFKDSRGTMPRQLFADLLDASTKGQVTRVVESQLGRTILKKPGRPGIISTALDLPHPGIVSGVVGAGLRRTPAFNIPVGGPIGDITSWGRMGRLSRVGDLAQTGGFRLAVRHMNQDSRMGRWTANMAGTTISADDLDEALPALDNFMQSANFSRIDRDAYLNQALRIRQGDSDTLYNVTTNIMKHWQTDLSNGLVANKFTQPVADAMSRRVTQLFDQTAKEDLHYMIDEYGHDVPHPMSKFDANNEVIAKPMLVVEQFAGKIGLPDPREVRKVLSLTSKWGKALQYATLRGPRTMKALTIEEIDKALDDGGIVHLLNAAMQDAWKPAQLLRLAWTFRVVGDEQLRMAAAGLANMFTHPLSYIAWVAMAHGARRELKKSAQSTGSELIDALARGDIDPDAALFAAHDEFQNALSKGVSSWRDSSTVTQVARRYPVGNRNSPNFLEGWHSQLGKYHADPITQAVAELGPVGARQKFPANHGIWRRMANRVPEMADPTEQDIYLQAAWMRVQREAGGAYDTHRGINGRVTGYTLTRHGDSDLVKIMADGEVSGHSIHNVRKNQPVRAALHQLQARLGNEFMTIIPETSVRRGTQEGRVRKFMNHAFSLFMTRPTNTFSRAPTFIQSWVEHMTAIVPDMSLSARQHARNVLDGLMESSRLPYAPALKMPTPAKVKRLYDLLDGKAPKTALLDGEEADLIARMHALQQTRDLLYDVTKRHNVNDALRIAIPFGESWWEILTSWGERIAERPTIPRRVFQTYQGAGAAQGGGSASSSFFSTDPATGELVFNYDPAGMLTTLATGSHPDATPVRVRGVGFVSGLNMLTTTMVPALGPVGQVLAANVIPDNESFQDFRELLLPFGELHPEDPSGILSELAPAWVRRAMEALDTWGGKEAFASTSINLYRQFRYDKDLLTGPITVEEQNALVELARQKSGQLGFIRTLVQWAMPTGMHLRYDIQAGGTEGIRQWNLLEASREWSRILEANAGDDVAALKIYTRLYGFNPILTDVPTSSYARRTHTTIEGDNWANENADLIADYPDTAWFINPDPIEGTFDQDAWFEASLSTDPARKALTVQQYAELSNQYLGNTIYAYHRGLVEPDGINAEESLYLAAVRDWVKLAYPSFREEISGLLTKSDIATHIADFDRMTKDPRVLTRKDGTPYDGMVTARHYLDVRNTALAALEDQGYTTFGSEAVAPVATAMKAYGSKLAMEHPEFYPVWNLVFKNEFSGIDEINIYDLFPTRPSSATNPVNVPTSPSPTIPTNPAIPPPIPATVP